MSASLVGSEMCIRDSPSHVADLPEAALPGPQSEHIESCFVYGCSFILYCLLYTSDAADDM
eukprot:3360782-Alexandrium_andersonii.AAC.1